jgi:hypothetical protein
MARVRSVKNQYRGINAHLHSLFQSRNLWSDFHVRHIPYLANALQRDLVSMGYVTTVETSLQIRRLESPPKRPRADILISDPFYRGQSPSTKLSNSPDFLIVELMEDEDVSDTPLRAVSIAPFDEESMERGEPVAWIELLSPSNKGDSQDAIAYREKRMDLLLSGMVYIEIDYLHETPPTFSTIARYYPPGTGSRVKDPQPYRIVVANPRPSYDEGRAKVEGFDVDTPIPTVTIPLQGDEALAFDFNAPYQKTFEESFYGLQIDYSELPRNFDRYLPYDQHKIALRMLSVMEAAREGIDVESGPFPLRDDLSLEAALVQLKAML